jgi:hypothetical protein
MKLKACVMLCKKCQKWTAYKSTKGGVKRIDTICKVCGSRIRHTHRPRPFTRFQGIKLRYGSIGSGGYQSFSSILDLIPIYDDKNPNKMASRMNKDIQRRKGRMMGFRDEEISSKLSEE